MNNIKRRFSFINLVIVVLTLLILGSCTRENSGNHVSTQNHEHTYATVWSNDENGHWYNSTCGHDLKKDYGSHTFTDWTVTKEATETSKGRKERICRICGYVDSEEIEELEHTHTYATTYSFNENYHWHNSTCGHDLKEDYETHDYELSVVSPTYEEGGYTLYTCRKCNYSYKDNYTSPLEKTYTLIFNFNGGTSASIDDKTSITLNVKSFSVDLFLLDLTKEGYNFRGWTYNDEHIVDEKGNLLFDPKLQDTMEFKAMFVDKVRLEITSNIKDAGLITGAGEYAFNSQVDLIAVPSKGYKFVGWFYKDSILSSQSTYNYMMWDKDIILEARFELDSFKLTLESNNSLYGLVTSSENTDANYNDKVSLDIKYTTKVTISAYTKSDVRFLGWYDVNNNLVSTNAVYTFTMPNTDYKLEAKWNYFKISYELEEGINSALNEYSYNSDYAPTLYAPTKAGYTFIGWIYNGEIVSEINPNWLCDITLTASWTPNTYTITLNKVDGLNKEILNVEYIKVDYNSQYNLLDAELKGYNFLGWYDESAKLYNTGIYTLLNDLTLYSAWEAIYYNINYDLDGGKLDNQPLEYTVEGLAIDNPSKTGYSFLGWTNDDITNPQVDFVIEKGTIGDINLIANWEINKYSITFKNYDETILSCEEYEFGTLPTYSEDEPSKESDNTYTYSFAGWDKEITLATADFVYTATYTSTYIEYTIIFLNYDDSIILSNTYHYQDTVTTPSNPSKPSTNEYTYEFIGWDQEITLVDGNKTYKALFSETNIDYTIIFKNYDGTILSEATYFYGSTVVEPTTPTKESDNTYTYSFAGWNKEVTEVLKDCTYTATYTSTYIDYTITFEKDGGSSGSDTTVAHYGVSMPDVEIPSKVGYSFTGYYDVDDVKYYDNQGKSAKNWDKIENTTLTAKWTVNTYNVTLSETIGGSCTVSFNLNYSTSNTISSQTVTATNGLSYPTIPTRSGYVFAGWYTTSSCTTLYDFSSTVTKDTTLYAKWISYSGYDALTYGSGKSVSVLSKSNTARYFAFVPLVSCSVKIYTQGSLDTYGRLYNSNKSLLASDDDSGSGNNFSITYNLTAGTLYYIWAAGYSSSGTTTIYITGTMPSANGKANANQVVSLTYDAPFTLPTVSKEGYTFDGWYSGTNGSGVKYTDYEGNSVRNWDCDRNTTLYPKWVQYSVTTKKYINSSTVTLDVKYVTAGTSSSINATTNEGYTFLGWYDGSTLVSSDSTYTFTMPRENVTLIEKWQINQYTITYNSNGGSDVLSQTLDFNTTLTTKPVYEEKTFVGWFDETLTTEYKRVPACDITLYAKWIDYEVNLTYSELTYIKATDTIDTQLFNATAVDTDGNNVDVSVRVTGTQTPGSVITVRLTATGLYSIYSTYQIKNIKVYGTPSIEYDTTKDYINLSDTLNSSLFNVLAKDSFDEALEVNVTIKESNYSSGDLVTVVISTTDIAGNTNTIEVPNIKVYGTPIITRDETITCIKESDEISNQLFGVTAVDSFSQELSVTTSIETGSQIGGNIITIKSNVTDSKGNTNSITYTVKVYGLPSISNAKTSKFKVDDEISLETLGIVSKDSFGVTLSNVTLQLQSGEQVAGETLTYLVTSIDSLGNINTKEITNIKIYGIPSITYNQELDKINYTDTINASLFDATSLDTFGGKLNVSVSLNSGTFVGGQIVTYKLSAVDALGNTCEVITQEIKVYSSDDIVITYSKSVSSIKATSTGEEFNATATNSFGDVIPTKLVAQTGYSIKGGNTINLYIVATDILGNVLESDVITNIKIYESLHITYLYDSNYIMNTDDAESLFNVKDDFDKELLFELEILSGSLDSDTITYKISSVDRTGNRVEETYTFDVLAQDESVIYMYEGDTLVGTKRVIKNESYSLNQLHSMNTTWYLNDELITNQNGESIDAWNKDSGVYSVYAYFDYSIKITYLNTYDNKSREEILTYSMKEFNYTIDLLYEAKTGYEFVGWYKNETEISNEDSYKLIIDSNSIEIICKYTTKSYTVTLDTTGYTFTGTTTYNVYYGKSYTFDVISDGLGNKQFKGWGYNGTQVTNENGYVDEWNIDNNVTLKPLLSLYTYTDSTKTSLYFGSYPKSKVSDNSTISSLNTLAGSLPTSSNTYNWTDYGYYISGSVSSYMYYIDIDVDSNGEYDYRGVYFTSYRPYFTTTSSSNNSQSTNGYSTRTVYWFKYQPIKWNILTTSNNKAMIISELILDSQDYNYTASSRNSANDYQGNSTSSTTYANNYMYSHIRSWLNTTFYDTAFTSLEKEIIDITNVDNSASSTSSSSNSYACSNTNDKMFLLSYKEATTYYSSANLRTATGTDYAKAQGLYVYNSSSSTYNGNSYYWLRSPYCGNSYYANCVYYDGYISNYYVGRTSNGVRAACWINL